MKFASQLWEKMLWIEHSCYCRKRRRRLKATDFTIIASNCIGTIMYHDMGLEFKTPTVNLTIGMPDLVKMAGNLRWYMEQELVECTAQGSCPTGLLGDIRVNFVHYDSFAEGKKKWEERRRRINWDRIVLVGADRDECDDEVLQAFDRLPWPNKLLFTHKDYPEFPSTVYITGFEEKPTLGNVLSYRPRMLKRRYLDEFDYVSFLNGTVPTTGLEGVGTNGPAEGPLL